MVAPRRPARSYGFFGKPGECLESQCLESQCLESQCLESQCLESQCLESQCLESQCLRASVLRAMASTTYSTSEERLLLREITHRVNNEFASAIQWCLLLPQDLATAM